MRSVINVACGVLVRPNGKILVTQRPPGKIAAGKWEFPGGKFESAETVGAALRRELYEELGIVVESDEPLIQLVHDYSDRKVALYVRLVDRWTGEPTGLERQALAWADLSELDKFDLLEADAPILSALALPRHYVFTPAGIDVARLVEALPNLPQHALLRLRQPALNADAYERAAHILAAATLKSGHQLILDRDPDMVLRVGAAGWHLSAAAVDAYAGHQGLKPKLVLASIHNDVELRKAQKLGANAFVVGTILPSRTHPELTRPLGWTRFGELVQQAGVPVYAIGGVTHADLQTVKSHYGQGVAGISGFWPSVAARGCSTAS